VENLINCGPLKERGTLLPVFGTRGCTTSLAGRSSIAAATHSYLPGGWKFNGSFSFAQVNPFEGGGEMFSGLGSRRCSPTILAQTVAL
jgi:hypothetical protein